jgi:hypothetical protein
MLQAMRYASLGACYCSLGASLSGFVGPAAAKITLGGSRPSFRQARFVDCP